MSHTCPTCHQDSIEILCTRDNRHNELEYLVHCPNCSFEMTVKSLLINLICKHLGIEYRREFQSTYNFCAEIVYGNATVELKKMISESMVITITGKDSSAEVSAAMKDFIAITGDELFTDFTIILEAEPKSGKCPVCGKQQLIPTKSNNLGCACGQFQAPLSYLEKIYHSKGYWAVRDTDPLQPRWFISKPVKKTGFELTLARLFDGNQYIAVPVATVEYNHSYRCDPATHALIVYYATDDHTEGVIINDILPVIVK